MNLQHALYCAPVGALFGQEVLYSRGAWPENNRHLLDDEAADALAIPEFESGPFFSATAEVWGVPVELLVPRPHFG